MIDIEQSELASTIMRELQGRLEFLRQTENFGPGLLHKINALLVDTRQRCKHQDIDFPVMAAIIVPSEALIEIVRADLDRKAIEQVVVNLVTRYSRIPMIELAHAVKTAFPDFKPARLQ